jgi:hypothetical protein
VESAETAISELFAQFALCFDTMYEMSVLF